MSRDAATAQGIQLMRCFRDECWGLSGSAHRKDLEVGDKAEPGIVFLQTSSVLFEEGKPNILIDIIDAVVRSLVSEKAING